MNEGSYIEKDWDDPLFYKVSFNYCNNKIDYYSYDIKSNAHAKELLNMILKVN